MPIRRRLARRTWERILRETSHTCYYCGASGQLVQEHVVAVVKGGPSTEGNVVPACVSCNQLKGTVSARTFFRWLGFLASIGRGPSPQPWCRECGWRSDLETLGCRCGTTQRAETQDASLQQG